MVTPCSRRSSGTSSPSTTSVIFEIADHAYLPSLVAREDLTRANASLSSTESVAEIAGRNLPGIAMDELSMGMSHDFEAAIERVERLRNNPVAGHLPGA